MINRRKRAFSIIIRQNKILFGYGKFDNEYIHFFIGGGIEEGELPEESALRELKEEANVEGNILFAFSQNRSDDEYAFLVDIGEQEVSLGYDPEEENQKTEDKMLQKLEWISLRETDKFTSIDMDFFNLLYDECVEREYFPEWFEQLKALIKNEN